MITCDFIAAQRKVNGENPLGPSLYIQWLSLYISNAGSTGSTPDQGTKIPHALQHDCCCCCYVTSVVSDSMRPRRRQPTRLRRPWDSPGKNTGMGLQHGKTKQNKTKTSQDSWSHLKCIQRNLKWTLSVN